MARVLLSRLLGERRWTQKKLADVTGIRPNTINILYHDMTEEIKLDHIDRICKALNCKLPDLIELDRDVKIRGVPFNPESLKMRR